MNRLSTHMYYLKYLSVAASYQQRHLLQTATVEQLNVLYKIAFNILQGTLPPYTNILRKLGLKEIDSYIKKQLLSRHSTASKELLCVFFRYYTDHIIDEELQRYGASSRSQSSLSSSLEDDDDEEEQPLLNQETESVHDGREWVQEVNTDTSVTLPAATALSRHKDKGATDPLA